MINKISKCPVFYAFPAGVKGHKNINMLFSKATNEMFWKKIEIVRYVMCLFHVEAFLIISDTYLKKTNKLSVC